jgi:hypothetical protein
MTEPRVADPLETRLGRLLVAYTEPSARRAFDPSEAARTAVAARRGARRGWLGVSGRPRIRLAGLTAAVLVVVVVGVASTGLLHLGPQTAIGPAPAPSVSGAVPSVGGSPAPEALRHPWQRPYAVTPGPDLQGSGTLAITADGLTVVKDVPLIRSTATVVAAGSDAIVVTASAGDATCRTGDSAAYRWTLDGQGTFLTLAPIGTDPCASRVAILGGTWVRGDLPAQPPLGQVLPAGPHITTSFDPFGTAAGPGRLAFTLPADWTIFQDEARGVVLAGPFDVTSEPGALITVMANPVLAEAWTAGSDCSSFTDAPGVGHSRDELVQAIRTDPDLVVSQPTSLDVGGFPAIQLDVEVSRSLTRTCTTPDGPVVAVPVLLSAGSTPAPAFGLRAGMRARLFLLDLGDGRVMAIAITNVDETGLTQFAKVMAAGVPVVQSFELRPAGP